MRNFYLGLEYFTDVTICTDYHRAKDPKNPTPEEMFEIIKKGPILRTSTHTEDHPEFAKLRKYLAEHGFIDMVTNSWNGDRAKKPFKLNRMLFKKGDRFLSACAMHYDMKKWKSKQAGPVTDSNPDGS